MSSEGLVTPVCTLNQLATDSQRVSEVIGPAANTLIAAAVVHFRLWRAGPEAGAREAIPTASCPDIGSNENRQKTVRAFAGAGREAPRYRALVTEVTSLHFLLLTVSGWVNRRQLAAIEYLREENRVLRDHLGDKRLRYTDAQRRRLAAKGKALGRARLKELGTIVTPDTILRWYRQLIATKYDGSGKRGPGRPRKPEEIRTLVVRMAKENRTWGYTRIVGAMKELGFTVGRSTVAAILTEHGLPPAPERGRSMTWSEFLRAHWDGIAAMDIFTVEAVTLTGLIRYHVLFVLELESRAVHIAGIVHQPDGAWIMQVGRNLTDAIDGFLLGKTHLIMDRDPVFTDQFRRLLRDSGVEPVCLPPRSPNLNAYAERFVGSVRRECLSQFVVLGQGHLRRIVREYAAHYHRERNHQGLGNRLIEDRPRAANDNGEVRCHQRLGGVLRYYCREAA